MIAVKEILRALEDYVPLLQTLVWSGLILVVLILLRKQLQSFLEAIVTRIGQGSPFKVGVVELGQQQIITQTADLPDNVLVVGSPDIFQLLTKAQGGTKAEGNYWFKSTKAMEVPGGCVVQVTTERQNPDGSWSNAEALTFVPGVVIIEDEEGSGRHLSIPDSPSEPKS